MIDYPKGLTMSDHIAHDMRVGRFPKRSSISEFLDELSYADLRASGGLPEAATPRPDTTKEGE